MRVLLIANTLPPHDLSGAGEQVLQLADGLRELGHEVQILGRGRGQARGPKILFPVTAVWPALRALRRFRPDVVQLHESDGGLVALAIRILGRWLPSSVLASLLQVSYREEIRAVRPLVDRESGRILARPVAAERTFRRFRAPIQLLLGRWTARLSDVVFAPSAETARELERDYRVAGVAVLPNVTRPPAGAEQETAAAEERTGPFLYVGRFRIRKGIEVLLEALARAPASAISPDGDTGTVLELAGSGERSSTIDSDIRRLGLEHRIRLLGRQPPTEVRALLRRARALVVPSTYEGMPLVVLEAMSVGCPVIASRVSGIPEVIEDGESGWLVEPERVGELGAALFEAWNAPAECARRGQAARRRLLELFVPERAADLWCRRIASASASAAGLPAGDTA